MGGMPPPNSIVMAVPTLINLFNPIVPAMMPKMLRK
jgi:hypothetical protein